jgi:hypothetical protein
MKYMVIIMAKSDTACHIPNGGEFIGGGAEKKLRAVVANCIGIIII